MYYKPQMFVVAGAIALSAVGPAFADSQLVASAGLTVEQAAGMTLTEIAQYKFNRDESSGDRWDPSIRPVAGAGNRDQLAASAGATPEAARSMSLDELVIAKFNREARPDDRQAVVRPAGAVVATRSAGGTTPGFAQLIATAGLTSSEAAGMSLAEIAQHKFIRDGSNRDR